MEFRVLGPLEVVEDGLPTHPFGPRERTLLATLLVRPGEVVSTDRLIDVLWGDDPPRNAPNALQAVVARVRRTLGPRGRAILVTRTPGYSLDVTSDQVDALRFEDLVARARDLADDDPGAASSLFGQALALWRGPPFLDVADHPAFQQEIARLEGWHLGAREDRIAVDLSLGRSTEVIGELEALVAEHPLREGLRQRLMVALYTAGRQADALRVYQETRSLLAEELGIDPGIELQDLHERILRHDPSLVVVRATEGRPRHNLPARITSFVGRDEELNDVRLSLDRGRLVTVIGPGGSGKTSLAIEVARSIVGSGDGSRNTAWFVDLSNVSDPSGVSVAVATALGLRGGAGRTTSTPTSPDVQVDDFVRANEPLLLLDNCEHVVEPVARLADRLLRGAPGARILATSREPLGLTGEIAWSIPGLAIPEATLHPDALARVDSIRLFAERAAASNPSFRIDEHTGPVIATICVRLDGLPLAIELAAARIRSLPLEEIARRIDDRFALLTSGERTAAPRQRTLRAAIDRSYELLSGPERLLFARLSVFPGTWTLETAETVCSDEELPVREILDVVSALVDKSMVEPRPADEPRFRMLETIREYAAERLEEAGETRGFRRRHAEHVLELVRAAGAHPESRTWLRALEEATDDIGVTLDRSLEAGDHEVALELCGCLGWYWATWHDHEGIRRVNQVLAAVPSTRSAALGRALLACAFVESYAPTFSTKQRAERSIELLDSYGDTSGAGRARLILAFIELMLGGDRHVADRLIAISEEALEASGDRWGVALAALSRFRLLLHAGSLPRALEVGHDALERFKALDDPWGFPWTTMWLGIATRMAGQSDRARSLFEDAISVAEELAYVRCSSHAELACLAALEGDHAAARGHLGLAAELAPETGVHDSLAIVANAAGIAARLRGDPLDAVTEHLRARAVFEELASEIGIAYTLCSLGFAEHRLGRTDDAVRHLRRALLTAEATGRSDIAAAALEGLACAAEPRDAETSGLLLGAAGRIRDDTGIRLSMIEGTDAADVSTRVEEALGAARSSAALARGARDEMPQVVRRVDRFARC